MQVHNFCICVTCLLTTHFLIIGGADQTNIETYFDLLDVKLKFSEHIFCKCRNPLFVNDTCHVTISRFINTWNQRLPLQGLSPFWIWTAIAVMTRKVRSLCIKKKWTTHIPRIQKKSLIVWIFPHNLKFAVTRNHQVTCTRKKTFISFSLKPHDLKFIIYVGKTLL